MLEKEIERKLICMIEDFGGYCLKFTCPGQTGVPDRVCLLPGGIVYWVETKRPKCGVLTEKQKLWRDRLLANGHNYAIVSAPADIERLRNIMEIMLEEE